VKRFQWAVTFLVIALAQCAHADTVDLSTITVDILPDQGGDNVLFSLVGLGTNITGVGGINCLQHWCSFFNTVSPGSVVFTNIGQIFLDNFNNQTVGGKTYPQGELGFTSPFSIAISGPIILPGNLQSSFTACVPASVGGPIAGFAGSGASFTQITLNTPTGGSLCTSWQSDGQGYQFVRGRFFVSTVPEPNSLALMASGLAGVLGAVVRHRKLRMR
jgi:hypothetical protein